MRKHKKRFYLGLDIGGTKCAGILLDAHGRPIYFHEIPIKKTWSAKELQTLFRSHISEICKRAHIEERFIHAIGIGVPGPVDESGKLSKAINLPKLSRVDFASILSGTRISLFNDACCALYTESLLGACVNAEKSIMLMLGTGLGSASMTRYGSIPTHTVTDIRNLELGHICANIQSAAAPELDKNPYALEAYCSRQFFRRRTKKSILKLAQEAREGNESAQLIFREFGVHLGTTLATVETLFQPEQIILGGGLIQYIDLFQETMRGVYHARRFLTKKPTPFIQSTFGPEVGAYGAALYSMTE